MRGRRTRIEGLDFRTELTKGTSMQARIYKRPKNAMQSGRARTDDWVLDFVRFVSSRKSRLMSARRSA